MGRLITIFLLANLILSCQFESEQANQQKNLSAGFDAPPREARPKGYWCFVNGNVDLTQITRELKEYKDKGFGTLDIWDVAGWVDPNQVIPAGPSFMGDESIQAIAHAIREAGKIGMDIGLTISSSWNAGGDWVKAEDGVMGLFSSKMRVSGPKYLENKLPFPEIPGTFRGNIMLLEKNIEGLPTFYKEVAVLAYQVDPDSSISTLVDISDHLRDQFLSWPVPEGDWEISRYICAGTGQPLMRPSPNSNGLMIDHFDADAMRKNMDFFFGKLESELGDLSKTALKYLYTDSYEANSAVWTKKMPEEFEKRRGYNLHSYLPVLDGYMVQNQDISERFLFDFKKTLSDLIIENHYVLGQKLCRKKGLEFIAEAGGPGPPIHNVPFESLSSLGKLSVPRGEFWFDPMWEKERIDRLQIVKGPASAAHLYGKTRVEAEAFTGTQIWQFGPGDLKPAADRAMCEGLTSFVYHTSPHIPREAGEPGWVYNFGTIINSTRTWWPKSKPFHYYLGRSCFLLQQGNFVADVLYYYGDYAPNFVPPKQIDPALGFGYDYDVCNSDVILHRLDVKDNYFVLPHGQKYKVLVLPDDKMINPDVLERLAILVKKGGVLIGSKPERSHSLYQSEYNDRKVKQVADEMWESGPKMAWGRGFVYHDRQKLGQILKEDFQVVPDVGIKSGSSPEYLDFIHRKTDQTDIYFFRNTTSVPQELHLVLRCDNGHPEIWEPDSGNTYALPVFDQSDGFTQLPLSLTGHGSVFILFQGIENPNAINRVIKNSREIFPATSTYFPVHFTQNGTVLNESGNFEFFKLSGTSISLHASDPDIQTLKGPWEIRFPHGWGTPTRIIVDTLKSWTEMEPESVRYFSGEAVYYSSFNQHVVVVDMESQIVLDLGEVSKVAEVYLNGHHLGIKWFSPYSYDITDIIKPGKNYLIVEVANVWSNQMTGDAKRSWDEKRTHTNITKGPNAWMTPYADLRLVKSGLIGPVTIRSSDKISLKKE